MERNHENTRVSSQDDQQSLDSTGKKKSYRRLFSRFAEKTSMVGVGYINSAKFWWAKLIWSCLLVIAVGIMGLHLWYLCDQFFRWPKQTKISLGFDVLNFPEITICNTNIIHATKLKQYRGGARLKDFIEALKPEKIAPDQFDPNYDPYKPPSPGRKKRSMEGYGDFNISEYDGNVDRRYDDLIDDDDFKGEIDMQARIEEVFADMYMDLTRMDRAGIGHNISEMMLSCTFAGRQCGSSMFRLFQTSGLGNCWSLSNPRFKVRTAGPDGGLSIVLYLQTTEYLPGITNGYGIRIQVHERNTLPFPTQEGLFIPASMETDVGLRMTRINRLGGKYGSCNDDAEFPELYNTVYTRRSCQLICRVQTVMDTCHCFERGAEEISRRINDTMRPCRSQAEIDCLVPIRRLFDVELCNCENPCSEIAYTKFTSQRQWPTDEYAMVLLDSVCANDKEACVHLRDNLSDKRSMNNNFLKLNIYYEDLNFENITEEAEIEVQQFLSDVGGAIGLWIGLSMLSLCELGQLLIELCNYCGSRSAVRENRRNRRKRRTALNEPNGDNHSKDTHRPKDNAWPNARYGHDRDFDSLPYPDDENYRSVHHDHQTTYGKTLEDILSEHKHGNRHWRPRF